MSRLPETLALHHEFAAEFLPVFTTPENKVPFAGPSPVGSIDHATAPEEQPLAIDALAIGSGEGTVEGPEGEISIGEAISPTVISSNLSGVISFPVQPGDGLASLEPFAPDLLVTHENEPPVITGQNPVTTPEDVSVEISISDLIVTDPDNDPEDFTIQVGEGENYSVSGQTVTPASNFSGTLRVPVTVNDGASSSAPFELQVSVTEVNDRPVITGQQPNPVSTGENQPVTIGLENLVVSDPDHSADLLTLTISNGDNYTVSENTITPVAGFSGSLSVSVTVSDPLASSESFPLQVLVAANVPPEITGQTELTTNEDASLTITLANLLVTDADDTYPTGFTFRLLAGDNYTYEGGVISPSLNYSGQLDVPVVVNDGISDSAPFTLLVVVQEINDAPDITGQVPLSIPENGTIALELSHLVIADPDNGPEDLTLSIVSGINFSVAGNEITSAPGYNGPLSVEVHVSDGELSSGPFLLQITVTPVNDPPKIAGQNPLEMEEGNSIGLTLQDVTVTDPDNTEGFTLIVQPGANYTFSGTTVTPSADFTGELIVNVVVSDGIANSETFELKILVTPVNDAPEITGPQTLSTNEDVPLALTLSHLNVYDPDSEYPSDFTLSVFPGANYSRLENTVIPDPDYYGLLTVEVQVSDGSQTSNIHPIEVQVSPVNDAPVITGQLALETAEDTPVTIQLSHLTVLDVDNTFPTGFSLQISPGANYTVSGSTITPSLDFNGTLNVGITVSDGTDNSIPFEFQIQVGNANDAPVITGQTALSTNEETAITLSLSHLTVEDPDNIFPNGFALSVSPGVNYTVAGETITPALNFAGDLTIPVRVNDGINNSPSFDFKLQVNQINDPPVFNAIPNLEIAENAPAGSVTITGISKGPNEEEQELTFVATSSNTSIIGDPVIQYNGGVTALLAYTVKPNTSGVVTITIVAIDNGSNAAPHQNSYSASFQIDVSEINSAPTLAVINNITLLEDAEEQQITLTGISSGPGEMQSLTVGVTSNKSDFFELLEVVYTSPETTGLLRFKTRPDVFGPAQLSVTVTDNGPATGPHVNSITRIFSVVIQPVNDPPVFTSRPVTVAVINEEYEYRITATDPDKEPVQITASAKPSWASLSPGGGSGQATLKGKPPAAALGNVDVTLQAKDATSTAEQSFTIYVNVRPAITNLSLVTEEDTPANFPAGFFASGYTDQNGNQLAAILLTSVPSRGILSLSDNTLKAGDTIPATSLSDVVYIPNGNYFGADAFGWKASDGYHFSLAARVDVSVLSVNDPPEVIFQNDTLRYEVNGESAFLSPLVDIIDPDDDSLAHAAVSFHSQNYHPDMDMLQFQNTTNIRANFDFQSGVLRLSGIASVDEYRTALRSIRYLHQNALDPLLEPKTVFYTLNDGEVESEPKNKVIILQYTFIEFEIPSGFTPNGDQANDTWVIDRPGGGLEELDNAIISVYNQRGVLVHRARGFDIPWDGTMSGELLPAGTYFFTIDLQLRNKKTYKGIVTILR